MNEHENTFSIENNGQMNQAKVLDEFKRLLKQIKKEKRSGPIIFKINTNQGGIRNTKIIELHEKPIILKD